MDTRLLLVLAASALCAVSLQIRRRYYFNYEHKTRDEALSYCREKHTDLATITSMDDMTTLRGMADLSKMRHIDFRFRAWIGLYDDVESWSWSLSDPSFYDPGEAEFRWWSGGDRVINSKTCVSMGTSGKWNVVSCTAKLKPVCCDVTESFPGPNVTFICISDSMTWTEAQSYCREHHTDLASVRNTAENQQIKDMVPLLQELWIGLSRESWKWFDGSNSSFRLWNKGLLEPNNLSLKESCVSADFGDFGKWEDWPCGYKRGSVCYTAGITKQTFSLNVQKNSSLDFNNAAVLAKISEQLKQKLMDEGLDEHIKLSWRKQPDGNVFHKVETEEKKKEENKEEECLEEKEMFLFL